MLWLVHKSVFKWANNSGHKLTFFGVSGRSEKVNKKAVCFPLHLRISVTFQSWVLPLTICSQLQVSSHFIFTKVFSLSVWCRSYVCIYVALIWSSHFQIVNEFIACSWNFDFSVVVTGQFKTLAIWCFFSFFFFFQCWINSHS